MKATSHYHRIIRPDLVCLIGGVLFILSIFETVRAFMILRSHPNPSRPNPEIYKAIGYAQQVLPWLLIAMIVGVVIFVLGIVFKKRTTTKEIEQS